MRRVTWLAWTLALVATACVPATADPRPFGGIELRVALAPDARDTWMTEDGWLVRLDSVQAPLLVGYTTQTTEGALPPCTSGAFRAVDPTNLLAGPEVTLFRAVAAGPCALVFAPGFAALDAEGTVRLTGSATRDRAGNSERFTFDLALGGSVAAYVCEDEGGAPVVVDVVNRAAVTVELVVDPVRRLRAFLVNGDAFRAFDRDGDDAIDPFDLLFGDEGEPLRAGMDVMLRSGAACRPVERP